MSVRPTGLPSFYQGLLKPYDSAQPRGIQEREREWLLGTGRQDGARGPSEISYWERKGRVVRTVPRGSLPSCRGLLSQWHGPGKASSRDTSSPCTTSP